MSENVILVAAIAVQLLIVFFPLLEILTRPHQSATTNPLLHQRAELASSPYTPWTYARLTLK